MGKPLKWQSKTDPRAHSPLYFTEKTVKSHDRQRMAVLRGAASWRCGAQVRSAFVLDGRVGYS